MNDFCHMRWVLRLGMLLALLLAFGLRLFFLLGSGLHVDEYITMMAVHAVRQQGYPRLPSGVFYDHGWPFTYLGVGIEMVGGSGATAVRFLALVFGVLSVALVYQMGRRWFSAQAGLYAAIILATTATAVIWGGRARMYTLQQFCFLLAVFGLVEGFRRNSRGYRLIGLLAAMMAVVTHYLTLAFLLAFAMGFFLAAFGRRLRVRFAALARSLWPEMAVLLAGCVLFAASRLLLRSWNAPGQTGSGELLNFRHLVAYLVTDPAAFLDPQNLAIQLLVGFHPLLVFPDLALILWFAAGSFFLLWRLVRRRLRAEEGLAVLLWATVVLGVFGVSLFLVFKEDRYILPVMPLYGLLVGRELEFVRRRLAARRPVWVKAALVGGVCGLLLAIMAPTAVSVAGSNPFLLECGWAYVKDHWRDGDAVATCMPATAYEWLGQTDYFAMETGSVTIETERGPADLWTGAPLVDSPSQMLDALDRHPRLWFVIDERAWEWFYSDAFQQVVEERMQRVSECPGMRVYVSGE